MPFSFRIFLYLYRVSSFTIVFLLFILFIIQVKFNLRIFVFVGDIQGWLYIFLLQLNKIELG